MKIPPFKCLNKTVSLGLCVGIITLLTACDKIPFFQDNAESEKRENVRVEWQNNDTGIAEKTDTVKPLQAPMADGKEKNVNVTASASPEKTLKIEQPSHDFAVQIGAFLKEDNATRLISELKKKGYEPSLLIVNTPAKKWNLVRIGSYTDKRGALKAAKKFTAAENMETAVVKDKTIIKVQAKAAKQATLQETKPEMRMPETVAKFKPERFSFQVGGLRTKANALKHQATLKKQGYAPYLKKIVNRQSKEIWYGVRIGTFDNIDLAADAADRFTQKESIPAQAVSVNN